MKKTNLLIGFVLLLTSCSDFINSRDVDVSAKPARELPQGQKNPFPAGFEEPTVGSFSEEKLLLNTGLNVVAPAAQSLMQELQIFSVRLEQSCGSNKNDADLLNQWNKVIFAFHKVDALGFGPLTDKNSDNLNLRSIFYAWPISNFCQVDKAVYEMNQNSKISMKLPYNSKGLDAIEYLLFENTLNVKCNTTANPSLKEWVQLAGTIKRKNRCDVAVLLTKDLLTSARTLNDQWDRDSMNFSKTLVDGSRFTSKKAAINELTNALYLLESVKDIRLGIPSGKNKTECTSETGNCPERVEHGFSDSSWVAIDARLEGFKQGFFGGDVAAANAYGIDDYLKQIGHPEISQKIFGLMENAEKSLQNLKKSGSLKQAAAQVNPAQCQETTLTNRLDPLCGFYEDIRIITSTMKTEVLIALSLSEPPVYQGDND